jgi:hypothetical protein
VDVIVHAYTFSVKQVQAVIERRSQELDSREPAGSRTR